MRKRKETEHVRTIEEGEEKKRGEKSEEWKSWMYFCVVGVWDGIGRGRKEVKKEA